MTRLATAGMGALLAASAAQAYPHFQLAGDAATCAACHYAPAGGGILTEVPPLIFLRPGFAARIGGPRLRHER